MQQMIQNTYKNDGEILPLTGSKGTGDKAVFSLDCGIWVGTVVPE